MHHGKSIDRLGEQLRIFAEEHPGSYGLLRHSPSAFADCTVPAWHARGWSDVKQSEINRLLHGSEVERLAAMLRLLHPLGIRRVEFAAEADHLQILPLVSRIAA